MLLQKDIATRELEEINLLGLQRLTEFTIRHVEAEVYVKKLITGKNIRLPCAQQLRSTPSPSFDSPGSSIASFNYRRRRQEMAVKQSVTKIRNVTPHFVLETVNIGESGTTKTITNSRSPTYSSRKNNRGRKGVL